MKKIKHGEPLYKRLLKEHYNILPKAVRDLHDLTHESHYIGQCRVQRGKNVLAQLCASSLSLPPSGEAVPLTLHFNAINGVEHWTRYFGHQKFYSRQWQAGNFLHERLPATTLVFTLIARKNQLELSLQQIYFLGIPIKSVFNPKIIALESEKQGQFHFYVHVTMPLIGEVITYDGYLKKDLSTQTKSS